MVELCDALKKRLAREHLYRLARACSHRKHEKNSLQSAQKSEAEALAQVRQIQAEGFPITEEHIQCALETEASLFGVIFNTHFAGLEPDDTEVNNG
jgi:hypothetical protein